MEYEKEPQSLSPGVLGGRVLFTLALAGCIWFIFSNSMAVADVSSVSSGRVLQLLQAVLRRLGHPALAQRLTMHLVRKMAHFCAEAGRAARSWSVEAKPSGRASK